MKFLKLTFVDDRQIGPLKSWSERLFSRVIVISLEECLKFYYHAFFGLFPMYDDKAIDPKIESNEVSTLLYALFNEFHAQYDNVPPPPTQAFSYKGKSIFKSAFDNLIKKLKQLSLLNKA
ncbi:unnamed protein product [Cuscuta epithymum]|uniref:Uncharacterized protein n=1 Tax=Cuscuta epithymum TaxID=186058 RepID=A0AAV0C1C1_9ASTE|nr:unnamed protein product [Cuscuta epithymum]